MSAPAAQSGPVLFTITLERPGAAPAVVLGDLLTEQIGFVGEQAVHQAVGKICRTLSKSTVETLVAALSESLSSGQTDILDIVEPGEGDFIARLTYRGPVGDEGPELDIEEGSLLFSRPAYPRFVLLVHGLLETVAVNLLVSAARGPVDDEDGFEEDDTDSDGDGSDD